MKRTQLIDIWRLITHAKGFFAVLVLIIVFGAAAFTGINFAVTSLFDDCEKFFDEYNLYDLEFGSVYGFDDQALTEIQNTEGVDKVGTQYLTHALFRAGQDSYVAEFYTNPGELNKGRFVEGRLPVASNECVVEKAFADRFGIGMGDRVQLNGDSAMLSHDEYIVVGVAELVTVFVTDDYFNRGASSIGDGQIATKILLADSGFSSDAIKQVCFVTMSDRPARNTKEYDERLADLKERILPIVVAADERLFKQTGDEIDSQIEDAQNQYDAGIAQLNSAIATLGSIESAISQGASSYSAAVAEYQAAIRTLAQTRIELESKQVELMAARAELDVAKAQIEAYRAELDVAKAQLDQQAANVEELRQDMNRAYEYLQSLDPESAEYARALVDYEAARARYDIAMGEYAVQAAQYAVAESQYYEEYAAYTTKEGEYTTAALLLEGAWEQYYTTVAVVSEYGEQLNQAESILSSAESQVASQKSSITQGQSQLYEMNEAIIKARQERAGLPWSKSFASDLYSNPSFFTYTTMSKGSNAIITTLCTLLMAIAILICYTTISRMVIEEHRVIGTQKALGVRTREIYAKYLVYVAAGSIVGVAIGVILSYFFFEYFVYVTSYGDSFILQEFTPIIIWPQVIILTILILAVMMLSAFLACRSLVRKDAIALLNDNIRGSKNPKQSKDDESGTKSSLDQLIILRGLRSNPQVLTTTLVCVAGTAILLISVLTVRTAMGGIAERQFDELQNYSGTLTINSQAEKTDQDTLKDMLETSQSVEVMPVMERYLSYSCGDVTRHASVLALDPSFDTSSFLVIRSVESGETLELPEDGVLVCQKIAENGDYRVGDAFALEDAYGQKYETTICGVFDRNIGYEIICSKPYYDELSGTNEEFCQYYLSGDDVQVEGVLSEARNYPAYLNYMDARYYESEMEYKVDCVNAIVMAILGASVLLSLFVLLNMAQMNIRKKSREIVVMKILGVPKRRIKSYVFWEAMIMCFIGLAVGVVVGGPLGDFLARAIEMENLVCIRGISPWACVIGAAVNAAIFTIINALSLKGVDRVKMTGSAREA